MSISTDPQRALDNHLLALLPEEVYEQLVPSLEIVSLSLKEILYQPDGAIPYVCFPLNAVVSLVIVMHDGQKVEITTVGNEGMIGLPVFLGSETFAGQAFVQVSGDVARMSSSVFKDEVMRNPVLQDIMNRYTQALFTQVAQSVACNRLHSIEQRCARWLLMTQDRVNSEQFPLTQEFLAQMLGVRRASVSEVAGRLQKAGLIQYSRGIITILNRPGLEGVACECYAIIKQEYERLLN